MVYLLPEFCEVLWNYVLLLGVEWCKNQLWNKSQIFQNVLWVAVKRKVFQIHRFLERCRHAIEEISTMIKIGKRVQDSKCMINNIIKSGIHWQGKQITLVLRQLMEVYTKALCWWNTEVSPDCDSLPDVMLTVWDATAPLRLTFCWIFPWEATEVKTNSSPSCCK